MESHRTDAAFRIGEYYRKGGKYDVVKVYNMHVKAKKIPLCCVVTSDHGNVAIFEIEKLVESFENHVLPPIIEHCNARGLYLDDWRDE